MIIKILRYNENSTSYWQHHNNINKHIQYKTVSLGLWCIQRGIFLCSIVKNFPIIILESLFFNLWFCWVNHNPRLPMFLDVGKYLCKIHQIPFLGGCLVPSHQCHCKCNANLANIPTPIKCACVTFVEGNLSPFINPLISIYRW